MLEIRLANTLLIELTLLTSTIPNSRGRPGSASHRRRLELALDGGEHLGKTRSRAIDSVIRAAGSRVVWVVATVEESTAMSIT